MRLKERVKELEADIKRLEDSLLEVTTILENVLKREMESQLNEFISAVGNFLEDAPVEAKKCKTECKTCKKN